MYYTQATERRSKEEAARQLALLHSVFAGSAAIESKEGFSLLKQHEAVLRGVIENAPIEKPKQADGLIQVQRTLLAAGARVSHSTLKK